MDQDKTQNLNDKNIISLLNESNEKNSNSNLKKVPIHKDTKINTSSDPG